jgi:hypothetical protein
MLVRFISPLIAYLKQGVCVRITLRNMELSLLFFFLFSGGKLTGQNLDDRYLMSYFSVEDGMSQSEVTSIVQDKYGFMWFGTRGGLNRFDGYGFLQYKPGIQSGQMDLKILRLSVYIPMNRGISGLEPNRVV